MSCALTQTLIVYFQGAIKGPQEESTTSYLTVTGRGFADRGRSVCIGCIYELWQKLSLTFTTRFDTNWAVQPQKMAEGLKFWI